MSDYKETSLQEELEIRVIALLTGELGESEADELEKILAINEELSAFRDRMAGLMGELHQRSDELVEPDGEAPRQLSEDRRARIFGDASVLKRGERSKRSQWKATIWGIAAGVCMLFFLSALMIPAFQKVRSVAVSNEVEALQDTSGMAVPETRSWEYEAKLEMGDLPVVGGLFRNSATPEEPMEPQYTVNLKQRSADTPPVPRPTAVTSPADVALPALDIEVEEETSAVYGRGGGGFGGGLAEIREMSISKADDGSDGAKTKANEKLLSERTRGIARAGEEIRVDIPAELIEGTPMPLKVPNLEPAPTAAPRMIVKGDASASSVERFEQEARYKSLDKETALTLVEPESNATYYAYSGSAATKDKKNAELSEKKRQSQPDNDAVRLDSGIANSVQPNVDPFAAPVGVRDESESLRKSGGGPVDAFAPTPSAEVEAKFMEVTQNDLDAAGFDWSPAPEIATNRPVSGVVGQNTTGLDLVVDEISAVQDLNGFADLGFEGERAADSSTGNEKMPARQFAEASKISDAIVKGKGDVVQQAGQAEESDVQAVGQTAIEKMAQERAQNVRQSVKPEKLAEEEPFSTFSLNISDVSFKLAQAALQHSRVPPSAQIRTEEFVNSFDYGDPAPRADQPVSLNWEIAQHPFEHDRQVVRFSLQTQASGRQSGQPLNLSLLVDNSGSMQRPDRQAILQNSLKTLEEKLTPQDKLNVVLFARQPRLIAEAQTRATQKAAVETALAYRPEGGTNLEAGLIAAYETADRNFVANGSNRVILMTDGAANLGNVNAGELAEYVIDQRKRGIALDAYGIGWDDYNDALLEEITRNGDGRYAFLNSIDDASDDFSEKLAGTLRVAAADVKVQIEWNPARVKRYRQIGYDLHQLKKEDFRNNTVDAAEIGEAESGTAIYVLKIDDDPEIIGGLGTLNVRYREPATGLYRELSWPLPMPRRVPDAASASPSMRLAMTSAFFGERLAESPYAEGYSFLDLYSMAAGLPEAFPKQPRVAQMQAMILQASELFREK